MSVESVMVDVLCQGVGFSAKQAEDFVREHGVPAAWQVLADLEREKEPPPRRRGNNQHTKRRDP